VRLRAMTDISFPR